MIAACLLLNLPGRSLVDRSVPVYPHQTHQTQPQHQTATSRTNSPSATPIYTTSNTSSHKPHPRLNAVRAEHADNANADSGGKSRAPPAQTRTRAAAIVSRADAATTEQRHGSSMPLGRPQHGGRLEWRRRRRDGGNGGLGDTGGGGPSSAAAERGDGGGAISATNSRLLACRAMS